MPIEAGDVRQGQKRRAEPEQLVLWKKRGGKRRGAGRPPKGARAGSPHKERPFLHARYPVHVTLRVIGAVGTDVGVDGGLVLERDRVPRMGGVR